MKGKKVQNIKVPLLFTCGRYDWSRPQTLALAMEGIDNTQLYILEQSAHMAHVEER